MHPSLHTSTLNSLPLRNSLKSRAKSVISGSDDPADTAAFVEDCTNRMVRDGPETYLALLPAFYFVLDNSNLPDVLTCPDLHHRAVAVVFSLRAVCLFASCDALAQAAYPDLWERIWPWVQFLDTHRDNSQISIISALGRYSIFLTTFQHMLGDAPPDDLPGLCIVVGRIWSYMVCVADDDALCDVSQFIGILFEVKDSTSIQFGDLLVGCGGSRADLASLIVCHFDVFFPTFPCIVENATVLAVMPVLTFLVAVCPNDVGGSNDRPLHLHLLDQGFTTTLMGIFYTFSCSTAPAPSIYLPEVLRSVVLHLSSAPSHRYIAEAVKANLLSSLYNCRKIPRCRELLVAIVQDILAPSLIHPAVVNATRSSLSSLRARRDYASFEDPIIGRPWDEFIDLFNIRRRSYKGMTFPSDPIIGLNSTALKCAVLGIVKRCGGCLAALYCSPQCQRMDWKAGHRAQCTPLRQLLRSNPGNSSQNSFFRALLTQDISLRRPHMEHLVRRFAGGRPDAGAFIAFNYTQGDCQLQVYAFEELFSMFDQSALLAVVNDGRIRLHLMQILEGADLHSWLFPQWRFGDYAVIIYVQKFQEVKIFGSRLLYALLCTSSILPDRPRAVRSLPLIQSFRRIRLPDANACLNMPGLPICAVVDYFPTPFPLSFACLLPSVAVMSFEYVGSSSSAITSLPLEILCRIFVVFCCLSNPMGRTYGNARCTLALVCKAWSSLVNSEPSLWYLLSIDDLTTVDFVQSFLEKPFQRPFAVSISTGGSGWQTEADYMAQWKRVLRPITVALSSSSRWSSLHIFSNHLSSIHLALDLILGFPLNSISRLSITLSDYLALPTVHIHNRLLSLPIIPSLSSLELVGVPASLPSYLRGHQVVKIVLDALPEFAWPSFSALASVITSSPALSYLALCATACVDYPDTPFAPVVASNVTTLRVRLGSFGAGTPPLVMRLLRSLHFPSLRCLDVTLESTHHVLTFLSSPFTSPASIVILTSDSLDVSALTSLYQRFNGVRSLDLRHSEPSSIAALSPMASAPPLLPRLTELVIMDGSWQYLIPVLARRQSFAPPINLLVLPVIGYRRSREIQAKALDVAASLVDLLWLPSFHPFESFN
ncbi:hypothetical protein K438DRAFT_2043256 [Mycena galopus ATCC 62051]|nr:hypothetical protein K438DRAFT_2043256 [Mycena galopus ATCC 62051]